MIRLVNRRLIIPRGDTGSFSIPVLVNNNDADQVAVFSIIDPLTQSKILDKRGQISDKVIEVEFNHSDTVNLPVGSFLWDIKFYINPVIADGKLIDGEEIDSYYAAYSLPACEIRQTGDDLLVSDDSPVATMAPDQIEIISSAMAHINTVQADVSASRDSASESASAASASASAADISADAASSSASAAEASEQAATSAAESASQSASAAAASAAQIEADLETKANVTDLSQVAFSGDYDDLSNVPTDLSEFTNGPGYLTQHQDISMKANSADLATVATSGSYDDLSNKPYIPNKVSDLTDDSGHYTKPVTGIPASDLEETYLTSFTETDPTVPAWAKASTKPAYTAAEVGAPTVGEMNTAISNAIGNVHQFSIEVVQSLPTTGIKEHTIYFVPKTGETNDVYDEYIRVNNAWEMIGNTQIDLSDYALKNELPTRVSDLIDDSGHYTKPVSGIPASDLAEGVIPGSQAFIDDTTAASDKAYSSNKTESLVNTILEGFIMPMFPVVNSKYTKPQDGIPASDLAPGVIPTVPVQDVKVNGQSILQDGVANLPVAGTNLGVIKIDADYGIDRTNQQKAFIKKATDAQVKAGTDNYKPIVPNNQHQSVFYGLAKLAGADMKNSSNPVGTYTAEAKTAIQTMLDVPAKADIPTNISELTNDAGYLTQHQDISGKADKTDTVLLTTLSRGRAANTTTGEGSYAFGSGVTASGSYSHSEGQGTTASGAQAHAEGGGAIASNTAAHAEGLGTKAHGPGSHAEGGGTTASMAYAHAEGSGTTASGEAAHSEGSSTVASATNAHAEGSGTRATESGAHSEGSSTRATGPSSHAENTGTRAEGFASHAEGAYTYAIGDYSHAEGGNSRAVGIYSHAENNSQAIGMYSHAEGILTVANGAAQHVSGLFNVADSYDSWNEWTANTSYSVGDKVKITTTSNEETTVTGYRCITANNDASFTSAKWEPWMQMNFAEIIGNGSNPNACSNAFALDWNGNGYFNGNIYIECNNDSSGGTKVLSAADFATEQDIQNIINGGAGA